MTANDLLDLQISEQMRAASRELCDLKYHFDMVSRDGIFQDFQNDWMGASGTCAFHGSTFLSRVVPFLDVGSESCGGPFEAMVDCRYVLGASIKGKPKHIKATDVPERIARYSKHHPDNGLIRASYWWYRPLGTLVAHEGKHRVAFMRTQGDLPIAATVTPMGYPAPERLKLIRVSGNRSLCFAMLDERYIQLLACPDVTRRYLSAYGVESCSWSTLEDMPDLSLVNAAIKLGGEKTVDLQRLKAFQSTAWDYEQPHRLDMDTLEGYEFDKRRYLLSLLGVLAVVALTTLAYAVTGWEPLQLGTAFLLGTFAALAVNSRTMRWRKQPARNLVAEWLCRSDEARGPRLLG